MTIGETAARRWARWIDRRPAIGIRKGVRYLIATILIVAITFLLPRLMPGNPVNNIIGEDVQLSAARMAELKADLGLDEPLGRQFARYLGRLVRLDLGYSYHYHRPVARLIASRLPWTLLLSIPSIILGACIGGLLGGLMGHRPGSPTDRWTTSAALVIYSVPPFFLALIALYLFGFRLGWFPLKGFYTGGGALDVLRHITLPALILTAFTATRNYTIMRGSVMQERLRHYVTFARAKGHTRRGVLFRHILRNASLPLLTMVALDFGFVVSGALFVEIVFSMNGMGTLIYESLGTRDYPVLQASFLTIAVMVMLANLAADALYGLIDPTVRRSG